MDPATTHHSSLPVGGAIMLSLLSSSSLSLFGGRCEDVHSGWGVSHRVRPVSPAVVGGASDVATQVPQVTKQPAAPLGTCYNCPSAHSLCVCVYCRCKPKLKLRIINQNSVSVLQTPGEPDTPTEQDLSRGQRSHESRHAGSNNT